MSLTYKLKICVLLWSLLLLQACSLLEKKDGTTDPIQQIDWPSFNQQLSELSNWDILGKVNVRTPEDSLTAAINAWRQRGEIFSIDLSSTFMGLGATNISGSQHIVTLIESGEEPLISDQPDELISSAIGLPLPLTNLIYWIKGIPTPHSSADITYDQSGLPSLMIQDGWKIEFSRFSIEHDLPLPGKIKLTREQTRIILAIKQWTLH